MVKSTVSMPKLVVIKNRQLAMFNVAMTALMIAFLGLLFYTGSWTQVHEVTEVDVRIEAVSATHALANQSFQTLNATVCSRSHNYEYRSQSNSKVFRCLPMCNNTYNRSAQSNTPGCFREEEFRGKHGMQDASAFFATSFEEENLLNPGTSEVTSYVIPGAEHMSIRIDYFIQVHAPWAAYSDFQANSDTTWTILLDQSGKPLRRIAPKEPLTVTVGEVFQMAKLSNFLDEPIDGLDPKLGHLNGSVLGRFAGAHVGLTTNCINDLADLPRGVDIGEMPGGEMVCVMQAKKRMSVEESLEALARTSPTSNTSGLWMRQLNGIRVTSTFNVKFRFYWPYIVVDCIISTLVLMQVPRGATMFFATHFLGLFSEIYTKAIKERFDLQEQVAGMAARMMVYSTNFLELQDNSKGISKSRIVERIKSACQGNSQLDEVEIENFADFVFNAIVEKDDPTIENDDFIKACGSIDTFGFEELIRLFDGNRKTCFIERAFMPGHIKAAVNKIRQNATEKKQMIKDTQLDIETVLSKKSNLTPEEENLISLFKTQGSTLHSAGTKSIGSQEDAFQQLSLEDRKKAVAENSKKVARLIVAMEAVERRVHDLEDLEQRCHRSVLSSVSELIQDQTSNITVMDSKIEKLADEVLPKIRNTCDDNIDVAELTASLNRRVALLEATSSQRPLGSSRWASEKARLRRPMSARVPGEGDHLSEMAPPVTRAFSSEQDVPPKSGRITARLRENEEQSIAKLGALEAWLGTRISALEEMMKLGRSIEGQQSTSGDQFGMAFQSDMKPDGADSGNVAGPRMAAIPEVSAFPESHSVINQDENAQASHSLEPHAAIADKQPQPGTSEITHEAAQSLADVGNIGSAFRTGAANPDEGPPAAPRSAITPRSAVNDSIEVGLLEV